MAIQPSGGGALERRQETSSLADVVGTILDKGVVIDVFARVSLVGIEVLRVDARVVVASVDTYLQFADAANRLELGAREPQQISDVVDGISEASAYTAGIMLPRCAAATPLYRCAKIIGAQNLSAARRDTPRPLLPNGM